jgi:hypothetical protein
MSSAVMKKSCSASPAERSTPYLRPAEYTSPVMPEVWPVASLEQPVPAAERKFCPP